MGANYRYNQFIDAENYVSQKGEIHVIPSSSPYLIRLDEVPDKNSGMTVKIMDFLAAAIVDSAATSISVANGTWYTVGDIITIDSEQMTVSVISVNTLTVARGANSTVATTHANVSRIYIQASMEEVAASPSGRQFWPDYSTSADSDNDWNTGTILFHESDAGKIVSIDYVKTGSLAAANAPAEHPAWYYDRGDGSDGDYVPTVSTTLANGVYNFKSVYIPAGVTITTGVVDIKCLGAFIVKGVLDASGKSATGTDGYSGLTIAKGGNCQGGTITRDENGNITAANGGNGAEGTFGGVGGAGKGSLAGNLGGSGGGVTLLNIGNFAVSLKYILEHKLPFGGGGGGAVGGKIGGDYSYQPTGGPSGGGSIYITAKSINNVGSILANGGNGGYVFSDNGKASGGGGGGGIAAVADTIVNTGTITATGGTSIGSKGSNNGAAGSDGVVYLKELGVA
jgi:hypothetical protein